jgi:hypothetical protein
VHLARIGSAPPRSSASVAAAPAGDGDYVGTRDIAMFSTDLAWYDFKASKPEKIVETVMAKVNQIRPRASS